MKNWWEGLPIREKWIVALAVVIGLVIVLDTLVFSPLQLRQQNLAELIDQAEQDVVWMRDATQRIPRGSTPAAKPVGRLVAFVNQQIIRAKLKNQMEQMTPISEEEVRIRLAQVPFNQLLGWLSAMQPVVEIEELRILPEQQAGLVSASLLLKKRS